MKKNTPLTGLERIVEGVRPFPHAVERVRVLSSNPSSSLADVARAIERDVGLSSEVLRLVNAAASGLTQACTSLQHATALLGAERIARLVSSAAALATVKTLSKETPAACAHALAVGGVARMLASLSPVAADEAFCAGLLHDVGSLLLLQERDANWEELVKAAADEGVEPNIADERVILGFDHARLGAEVLRKWKMPEALCRAIELHHDWDVMTTEAPGVVAIGALVVVADTLEPRLTANTVPTREDLDLTETHPAFACLGLGRDALFSMWEGLRAACAKGEAAVLDLPAPERPEAVSTRYAPETTTSPPPVVLAVCASLAAIGAAAALYLLL